MPRSNSTYIQAVQISEEYLGPAAERFMRRQINIHLNIEPEDLQSKQLPELTNWVKLAYALLTDNTAVVEQFATDLNALSERSDTRATGKHATPKKSPSL